LDNELILQQFDKIEEKVEGLVEVCKTLESTNLELRDKIERLEEELKDKVETENRYVEEKSLIRSKIDMLLVRLDNITEVSA
jgi:cell division protein ZapB